MEVKIFKAKWVICEAEKEPVYEAALAVQEDKILEIGKSKELEEKYKEQAEIIDFGEKIISPGLVNAHSHISMSIFRGLAEDLPLMTWLTQYIFPLEANLNPNWVYWGAKLSLIELIRSGVTLFCDMYIFEEEVIKATKEAGIKALLGEGLFDFPSPNYGPLEKGFELTEELIRNFERDELIKIAVSPHTLYTCSKETVKKCVEISEKYGVKLHIHLSESTEEVNQVKEKYGDTPGKVLHQIGGISRNLLAAHCVKLTQEELELFAKFEGSIVHCPESNLKLGSGIAPVVKFLEKGINFGLGTDGPASNNDLDMFCEMRTASLLQKGIHENPSIIGAKEIFKSATEDGAIALGFEDTGKLAPGYKADFIVIDLSKEFFVPDYNPLSLIVYAGKSGIVSDVVVNGKWIMKNYHLLTIDEEEVIENILKIKKEILSILEKK